MAGTHGCIARKDLCPTPSLRPAGAKNETYGVKARALTGPGFLVMSKNKLSAEQQGDRI